MGRFLEDLVQQRQTELARWASRPSRPSRPLAPGRTHGRRRARLVRRTGRLLVAAGVRLAGPEARPGANPLSV